MYLSECVPMVHGPQNEIQLVQKAVATWAHATLGLANVGDSLLVGSRGLNAAYISVRNYTVAAERACGELGENDKFGHLMDLLPDLDLDAHVRNLYQRNLADLAGLTRYRDYGHILKRILPTVAADWDIVIPQYRHFERFPIEKTLSQVNIHPPYKHQMK